MKIFRITKLMSFSVIFSFLLDTRRSIIHRLLVAGVPHIWSTCLIQCNPHALLSQASSALLQDENSLKEIEEAEEVTLY